MFSSLFNSDDDWQEDGADYLYPKLHDYLTALGKQIGIPLVERIMKHRLRQAGGVK